MVIHYENKRYRLDAAGIRSDLDRFRELAAKSDAPMFERLAAEALYGGSHLPDIAGAFWTLRLREDCKRLYMAAFSARYRKELGAPLPAAYERQFIALLARAGS